jgi:hypothetical protein
LIALLDADDYYLPAKLAADLAAFDADPGSVWVVRATRWAYEGLPGHDWTERQGLPTDRSYDPPHFLIHTVLRERGDVPSPAGSSCEKDVVEAVGGFEESFRLYEDQALWVKLILAGRTRVGSGCDAIYRQHPTSTSALAVASGDYHPSRPHPARRAFLQWLRKYAASHGVAPYLLREIDRAEAECIDGRIRAIRQRLRRLRRYVFSGPRWPS